MSRAAWQQAIRKRVERIRRRKLHLIDGVGMRGWRARGLEDRFAKYQLVHLVCDPTCGHERDEEIAQPEEDEPETSVGIES